jgi:hypothetical protein
VPIHGQLLRALDEVSRLLLSELGKSRELLSVLRDVHVYEIKALPGEPPDVVAGDSSRALRSYSMALVYAVQAVAVRVRPRIPGGLEHVVEADAGYYISTPASRDLLADELVKRVVQFISRELEVESVRKVSEGAEIAFFDGSIFSFLWYGKFPEVPESLVSFRKIPRKFRDIWSSVVSQLVDVRRSGTVPMFVAKTIRRSYYVGRLLGDSLLTGLRSRVNDLILVSLLRASGRIPRKPCILEPVWISSVEEMPKPLNTLELEDRRLVEPIVPVTVTYVFFSPTAQPYQLTVPGRWGGEELAGLVSSIYPYSYSGYPDPLKVAHNMCRLSTNELRQVLAKLGLSSIPTGRELLGEVV